WSPLEAGLAVFPAGLLVTTIAPRVEPLVRRFGTTKVILAGLTSSAAAYALFLGIAPHSNYWTGLLPTFVLAGTAFGLAYGPLNIAATNGVAAEEQGLAGGIVTTSFQFGGAVVLAVVTAVNDGAGSAGSPQGMLDGFHAAVVVSLIVAVIGAGVTAAGLLNRRRPVDLGHEPEAERELVGAGTS
ncbi:MAG: MFS transporter, partial [Mycobacteriales bacterium]